MNGADDDVVPYLPQIIEAMATATARRFEHMTIWHWPEQTYCDGWTYGEGRAHRIPLEDVERMRKALEE